DQYTSQPEYWNETEAIVGDNKSTLNLILPELYLEDEDVHKRISNIHNAMESYIKSDSFDVLKDSMIYIERVQSNGTVRAGLVGALDLEEYDYHKGSKSLVRATEATVVERIPPRMEVRRGAMLELPHIMILIDDDEKTVVEPVAKLKDHEKLYDFMLMQNGGSIKGWKISQAAINQVTLALEKLGNLEAFNKKYNLEEKNPLVYAMGDGNHSLATAKEFYEELKRNNPDKDMSNHPARYALVEIVNLHSPALEFEAIHRIVTEINRADFIEKISQKLGLTEDISVGQQVFKIVCDGQAKKYAVTKPTSKLTVGSVQEFLDEYLEENGGKIDYIHGIEVIDELSRDENSIGFVLPDMSKDQLFPTVICDGALPRKTFSMGHAEDKRYYVEARKISLD
ncbi:MAG: DUF1015 domain-containing protein, partial [Clostridiales bacterium]|nr:DUF1015 domain-containing protein [Clostridiales bacterium]